LGSISEASYPPGLRAAAGVAGAGAGAAAAGVTGVAAGAPPLGVARGAPAPLGGPVVGAGVAGCAGREADAAGAGVEGWARRAGRAGARDAGAAGRPRAGRAGARDAGATGRRAGLERACPTAGRPAAWCAAAGREDDAAFEVAAGAGPGVAAGRGVWELGDAPAGWAPAVP
jgi:hypothetical protein